MRMDIKSQIRRFFGFSRRETFGFMILIPLMVVIIFSEPLYRSFFRPEREFASDKAKLDSLIAHWKSEEQHESLKSESENSVMLFAFNPETASQENLKALGFSEKQIQRLLNYREKGGRFRIKSDLLKLYGMDSAFYQSLAPYIQLPEKIEYAKYEKVEYATKVGLIEPFDLNQADTVQLQKIYGIGSVLALRIVKYRDKLGGFINQGQLGEVYGLDSAVISTLVKRSFIQDFFSPIKINVNKADEMGLSNHPYISKSISKSIVAYRFQHGNLQSIHDLEKIHMVDANVIRKISPYLTFD